MSEIGMAHGIMYHVAQILKARLEDGPWVEVKRMGPFLRWPVVHPWINSELSKQRVPEGEHPLATAMAEKSRLRAGALALRLVAAVSLLALTMVCVLNFESQTYLIVLLAALFIVPELVQRMTILRPFPSLLSRLGQRVGDLAVTPLSAEELVLAEYARLRSLSRVPLVTRVVFGVLLVAFVVLATNRVLAEPVSVGFCISMALFNICYLTRAYFRGFGLVSIATEMVSSLRPGGLLRRRELPFEIAVRITALPLVLVILALGLAQMSVIRHAYSLVSSAMLLVIGIALAHSPFVALGHKSMLYEYHFRVKTLHSVLTQRDWSA